SAAAVWPLAARAQQSRKVPLIGVLWPNPPSQFEFIRQGLADLGYVEGKNINFEFRWAEGALDKLPELAMELVRIPVDLIVTLAPPATLAAQRPNNSSHPPALRAVESSARSLSLQIRRLEVRAVADLDNVFTAVVQGRADGVLFIADPIFFIQLKRMADFVTANRLPAIANFLEFPKFGGLMGYAPSLPDEYRHAAKHIDRILKGANPADLPVEQPTKFQLVINVKTAKIL